MSRHAEVDERQLGLEQTGRRGRDLARLPLGSRDPGLARGLVQVRPERDRFGGGLRIRVPREHEEDVPRMRVGMKVPVDRDLLQVRPRQLVRQRAQIDLAARGCGDLAHFRAANALGGEHALGRVSLYDARH